MLYATTDVFPRGRCGRKSESVSTYNTQATTYMNNCGVTVSTNAVLFLRPFLFEIAMIGYQTTTNPSNQLYSIPINSILLNCVTYLAAQTKLKKTICPNPLHPSICLNCNQENETSFNQQCYVTDT